jgi:[ribosomal protein S5]-alanine N-acetyltransferase
MIETRRLIIKPLTYEQLVKYTACDNSLEQELNVKPSSRTISPELKEALEETILLNVADTSKNYLYSTLWTAISKAENKMIGDLCIVGEPNAAGEIEIGYGTYDEFQGMGYMTEMVAGIISWAQTQPSVKSIVASTEKMNEASFRVLVKNGFIKINETDATIHWKLELTDEKKT